MRRRRTYRHGTASVTIAEVYESLGMELLDPTPRQEKNGVVSYEDPETGRIYTFNQMSGLYYTTTMTDGRPYQLNGRNGWNESCRVYGLAAQMRAALFTILASRLA